jgi:hypothetical protein
MSELTIILKDIERTYRHRKAIYQPYTITYDDPIILEAIAEAKKNFVGEPDEIIIKIHFQVI